MSVHSEGDDGGCDAVGIDDDGVDARRPTGDSGRDRSQASLAHRGDHVAGGLAGDAVPPGEFDHLAPARIGDDGRRFGHALGDRELRALEAGLAGGLERR